MCKNETKTNMTSAIVMAIDLFFAAYEKARNCIGQNKEEDNQIDRPIVRLYLDMIPTHLKMTDCIKIGR